MKIGFSRDAFLGIENQTTASIDVISVTISPIVSTPGEFIIASGPTSFTLIPSEGINLLLRCLPTSPGQRTAMLKIITATQTKEVFLIGDVTSTQPDVRVNPPLIDFGTIALGETKDSSYTIYGAGIDSISIVDLLIENDNGDIFFEAFPKDGIFAFPEKIGPNDSLVIHARFIASTPSGVVTGRAIPFGEVTGDLRCEFRGEIGYPELSFSSKTIDIGVRAIGEVVDTFVYIESKGNAPAQLEEIIPPAVFTIVTSPSVPQFIAPSNTLRVDLRFTATKLGVVNDVLGALAKSNASGGKYREVVLKATVIAGGLTSQVDSTLSLVCGATLADSLSVTISDTGNYDLTIDSVRIDNANVTLSSRSVFPLSLTPSSTKQIHVIYTSEGTSRSKDSAIIEYFMSGYVIIRDTLWVTYKKTQLPLAVSTIARTPLDYTDSIGLGASNAFTNAKLYVIDYEFRFVPDDIAEIDVELFNSALETLGGVSGIVSYNRVNSSYLLRLSSDEPILSTTISSIQVPIQYYVSKQSTGSVVITSRTPGSEFCYDDFYDTLAIVSPELCGDAHIRDGINNTLTASFIGMRVLTTDNNFTATYRLAIPSDVTLDWYSQLGELVASQYLGSISNGIHTVSVSPIGLSSGSLIGRLTTVSNGTKSVVSSVYHIIK